jgi:hypothetical protein
MGSFYRVGGGDMEVAQGSETTFAVPLIPGAGGTIDPDGITFSVGGTGTSITSQSFNAATNTAYVTVRATTTATLGNVVLSVSGARVTKAGCKSADCLFGLTGIIIAKGKSSFAMFGGGGDVWIGNGEMAVTFPPNATPAPKLIADAANGVPGMLFSSGVEGDLDLTEGNISSTNWYNEGTWVDQVTRRSSSYYEMRERIQNRLAKQHSGSGEPLAITSSTDIESQVDSAASVNNKLDIGSGETVAILKTTGDITTQAMNIGTRKVLWLVEGNVTIGGGITVDPTGFFGLFASGNMIVDDGVKQLVTGVDLLTATPDLTGIFFAQGSISTCGDFILPSCDSQLRIDGSVIGMGGVTLDRTYMGSEFPAEYLHFKPDLTYTLYRIGPRQIVWKDLDVNP